MKKVLITGATGFVGRQCVPILVDHGYEVHAVTSGQPPRSSNGIIWHQANLLQAGTSEILVSLVRPSHLLHLAWYAVPGKYWTALENFHWVRVSLDLFEAFAARGGRRIVAAGTCAEYDWSVSQYSERTTPLIPTTPYGICKHSLQLMLRAFADQCGLSAAWGRLFFLYGPYEHPRRLVASVICSLLAGERARCSHGRQMRDMLYVNDAAHAFVTLLSSEVEGAVNIGSGHEVELRDLINQIAAKLGREDLVQLGAIAAPLNDPPVLVAEVNRLHNEVKWQPRYDLTHGLEETIHWWRAHLSKS